VDAEESLIKKSRIKKNSYKQNISFQIRLKTPSKIKYSQANTSLKSSLPAPRGHQLSDKLLAGINSVM
jgi:hypothetical protein